MDVDEFWAVAKAFQKNEESREREQWERTRVLATLVLRPVYGGTLSPQRLFLLPWDKREEPKQTSHHRDEERMQEALKKMGSTY